MSTVGKSLRLSAAALGSLGLVVSVIENFRHFSVALEENFWTFLVVSLVLSLAAVWPESNNRRPLGFNVTTKSRAGLLLWKYCWVMVITLIFLGAGYYRYHIVNSKGSGERPVVKPGDIPLEPAASLSLIPSAFAQTRAQRPRLSAFTLRREKTLYIEDTESGKKLYSLSGELMGPINRGKCAQDFDGPSDLVALKAYAVQADKQEVLKYIETEKQLESLVADHPDIARKLMPTKTEWSKLSRADYFAVLNWVRNCVGIAFPVFIATIENPTNRDILITGINYNVSKIAYFPPVESPPTPFGPLTPTATYTYQLAIKQGVQSQTIEPPFRVPANSSESLELQLHSKTDPSYSGITYTMNIEFVTNQSSITTDVFLLHFRTS
jgi:hypothetical protein